MAKQDMQQESSVDAAEAKRQRKAAKRAAAEALAAQAGADDVVEAAEDAVDPAEAKRARKAAKKAAAEAAAAEEAAELTQEVDAAEAKRARKAAKKAAAEAAAAAEAEAQPAEEEQEEDPAEAKKKRKAAKKAAAEAKAAAEEDGDAEMETPPAQKAKATKEADAGAAGAEKPAGGDESEDFRLFLGGLPWSVTEEMLRKDFGECGEVTDVKILTDRETGQSKGVAFLTMAGKAGYEAALKYDGEDYGGRRLNVNKANSDGKGKGKGKDGKGKGKDGKGKSKGKGKGPGPKPDGCTSVVCKGLAYAVTSDDLQEAFKACGDGPSNIKILTDRETGESKGIAFIDFDNEAGVDQAMKLTETELKGRRFFMDYSQPRE